MSSMSCLLNIENQSSQSRFSNQIYKQENQLLDILINSIDRTDQAELANWLYSIVAYM